ncbi:two component LuxR family transcriptional regulator [Caballeronia novacaledonica]|uniref:Two component LuxR family transcriptional regulator n=1 Tax=Caballeronia novacaledonica TaxID=1544861 RepID=A0A2U3I0R6_9BURK|nr:response regulator [Caballeronia novacaledonica]SPB13672.1 two component LuxR family transcriptional regulator [Caballeronia novacaledonica]
MEKAENRTTTYQPRLLLVDDDPAMVRIIGEMLAEFPNQRFAVTGEAALALARESIPDLILLDANLPNMTGFDVCEILKNDAKLARVPVIFITSHDAPALEVDAFRMGAADYVIKPLAAPRLQARVRAQLRLRHRVMEAQAAKPATTKPTGVRVLGILEDDMIEMHRRALEAIGALDLVKDCETALRLAQTREPDAIVLDARCCDNPCNAVRTLLAELAHVPIVVLADARDAETEQCTLDAGAADVIAKPAKSAVLQARVQGVLTSARQAREELRALMESAGGASVHPFPVIVRDTRTA